VQSTAVRKAARAQAGKGPKGVVYFNVGGAQDFGRQLGTILNVPHEQWDLLAAIRRRFMSEDGKTTEPKPSTEPHASWQLLASPLMAAAEKFQ